MIFIEECFKSVKRNPRPQRQTTDTGHVRGEGRGESLGHRGTRRAWGPGADTNNRCQVQREVPGEGGDSCQHSPLFPHTKVRGLILLRCRSHSQTELRLRTRPHLSSMSPVKGTLPLAMGLLLLISFLFISLPFLLGSQSCCDLKRRKKTHKRTAFD